MMNHNSKGKHLIGVLGLVDLVHCVDWWLAVLKSMLELAKMPKCWACWDTHEDEPFIRACTGCLDPDLQYIHQSCIDSFINYLPNINSMDLDLPEDLTIWEILTYRPTAESLPLLAFKCTRCCDPYDVEIFHYSRFQSLIRIHQSIFCALIGLFLCSLVVIVSSALLLLTGNELLLNSPVFAYFGFPGIPIKVWSILLCIGYSLLNFAMWILVIFKIPPFRVVRVLDKESE